MSVKARGDEGARQHFGAVRYRVVGSGNLRTSLESLSAVRTTTLAVTVMSAATDVEPTRLANFTTQRGRVVFGTTGFDEYLQISRITVFTQPVAEDLPR